MNKRTFLLMFVLVMFSVTTLSGRSKPRQIVVIGLDGISVEGLAEAKTPNLDFLFSSGASSLKMRNVMPTITMPNWTSHLTGSGPEQHGVVSNGWTSDNVELPGAELDSDGFYPSVFSVIKESMPECATGFIYDWRQLIYPFNKKNIDYMHLADVDDYLEIYKEGEMFIQNNKNNSFFLFMYAGFNDNVAHRCGWMSPEYIQSIEKADARIGLLFDELKKEGIFDDVYILFITDHGGVGHNHGGNSVKESIVPWAIMGPTIKSGYVIEEPVNTIDTAPIILDILHLKTPDVWIGRTHDCLFKGKRR